MPAPPVQRDYLVHQVRRLHRGGLLLDELHLEELPGRVVDEVREQHLAKIIAQSEKRFECLKIDSQEQKSNGKPHK